ncbi:hypothetical protein Ga0466249_004775 [Sporomusaceae bacterium BoRhaA]|nr:hypothetical protein [Pelorhabdus rhamnosifermentans]
MKVTLWITERFSLLEEVEYLKGKLVKLLVKRFGRVKHLEISWKNITI